MVSLDFGALAEDSRATRLVCCIVSRLRCVVEMADKLQDKGLRLPFPGLV